MGNTVWFQLTLAFCTVVISFFANDIRRWLGSLWEKQGSIRSTVGEQILRRRRDLIAYLAADTGRANAYFFNDVLQILRWLGYCVLALGLITALQADDPATHFARSVMFCAIGVASGQISSFASRSIRIAKALVNPPRALAELDERIAVLVAKRGGVESGR